MATARQKAYLDAEKITPKHQTPGCSLRFVCGCVSVCGCVLRAYGVRCMGRLWAEMRREFLSCCVMSIYPCSDGGFPNNGVEAEGQKAMTVNKKKIIKKNPDIHGYESKQKAERFGKVVYVIVS